MDTDIWVGISKEQTKIKMGFVVKVDDTLHYVYQKEDGTPGATYHGPSHEEDEKASKHSFDAGHIKCGSGTMLSTHERFVRAVKMFPTTNAIENDRARFIRSIIPEISDREVDIDSILRGVDLHSLPPFVRPEWDVIEAMNDQSHSSFCIIL